MNELRDTKCKRCRCYRYPSDFIKDDRVMKTCKNCREYYKKLKNENKCPHKRQKQQCIECNGSQICDHKKQKAKCRE